MVITQEPTPVLRGIEPRSDDKFSYCENRGRISKVMAGSLLCVVFGGYYAGQIKSVQWVRTGRKIGMRSSFQMEAEISSASGQPWCIRATVVQRA
jgi:hypothetical protein